MTAKNYVDKWTLQLDEQFDKDAKAALQLSGLTRQQMLERALKEYIANHKETWKETIQKFLQS